MKRFPDDPNLPSRVTTLLTGARGDALTKAAAKDREDATVSLILPCKHAQHWMGGGGLAGDE